MEKSNIRVQQTPDEASAISAFLWWLATAEKELISNAVVDRNRYRIIGLSVLCTWVFATLAWTYFFSTVMDNDWAAILPGLFMGFVILCIDRALIKGINRKNKRKFIAFGFRAILALSIGLFMAQPAILYLFDKEIKMQTSLDNEKRKQLKKSELDTLYATQLNGLSQEKSELQTQLAAKYNEVAQAQANYLAESDGSGGTGKIGISTIALAKKHVYEKINADYLLMKATNDTKIDSVDAGIGRIKNTIQREEALFESYLNDGFLTRIEALENLLKSNPALQARYYLIVFILLLIELMPVIAKSAVPAGTYEAKVEEQEEMEAELANLEYEKEKELRKLMIVESKDSDGEMVKTFFKEMAPLRKQRMQEMSGEWSGNNKESFDGFWKNMKRQLITRLG